MFEKYKEEREYRKGIPFKEFDETIDKATTILFDIYQTYFEKFYPMLEEMARYIGLSNSDIEIALNEHLQQEIRFKRAYNSLLTSEEELGRKIRMYAYNNYNQPIIDLDSINYDELRITRKLYDELIEIDGIQVKRLKRNIALSLGKELPSLNSKNILIEPVMEKDYNNSSKKETSDRVKYEMKIKKENLIWDKMVKNNVPISMEDTIQIISFRTQNNRLLKRLKETIEEYQKVSGKDPETTKLILTTGVLFPNSKDVSEFFKNKEILKRCDLSKVDFNDKNISGLDISENIGNVFINFDKIDKDLSNSVIKGYNLSRKILSNYNLTDTDLTQTSAGIDILSCTISTPSKMSLGTQFDENNRFYLGDKEIPLEEAKKLNLSIK